MILNQIKYIINNTIKDNVYNIDCKGNLENKSFTNDKLIFLCSIFMLNTKDTVNQLNSVILLCFFFPINVN